MAQINLDQWPLPPITTGLIVLSVKHGKALASTHYYKNIFGAELYHEYSDIMDGPRACNQYTMVIGGATAYSFKFVIRDGPHSEGPVERILLWLFTPDPNALATRAIKGGCEDLSHEIAANDPNQVVIRRIRDENGYLWNIGSEAILPGLP